MGSSLYALLAPASVILLSLVLLKVLHSLGQACLGAMLPATLSEIIDYDTLKTGKQRSGTYFATYTFLTKTSGALATSLGLGVAGWYGFNAMATTQSTEAVTGLILAMCWIPIGLGVFCYCD